MRQRDIATINIPAIMLLEKMRQGFDKNILTLGSVIIRQGFDQLSGCLQLIDYFIKRLDHFWNSGRVTTAHHYHIILQQALVQIIHQMGDARVTCETITEIREIHLLSSIRVNKPSIT